MKSTRSCAKNVRTGALFLSGIAALVLQVPLASAADFGLGVAHQGSGNTVLIPIRTESLFIEPEIRFDANSASGNSFHSVNPGVGVYWRKELGALFETYIGGKLAFGATKQTIGTTETKTGSITLGPTVGIQHFFSKQFSLGLDASLPYQHGKTTQTGQPDTTFHSWSTETRVLLRAFF